MTERSPGIWRLRVVTGYDPQGRPRQASRTFKGTKKQAEAAMARFATEVADQNVPLSGSMTLAEFIEKKYLPHIESRGKSRGVTTHASYATKSKRIIDELGRTIRLDKLTAADIDRAYSHWIAEGLQPSYVGALHTVLSAALTQANKWDLVRENVANRASPPGVSQRAQTMPTLDEIGILVDASADDDPTLSVAVMLGTLTGLRRSELLGLRWSDVSRDKMTLGVFRAVKQQPGRLVVGDTKNHRRRFLAIDSPTLAVLDAHREHMTELYGPRGDDSYIISWEPNGDVSSPSTFEQRFHRLKARLSVNCRLHDLRHRSATDLLAHGTDVATVAARHGSTVAVVMRTYLHPTTPADVRAAGVMSELLAATKTP